MLFARTCVGVAWPEGDVEASDEVVDAIDGYARRESDGLIWLDRNGQAGDI